MTFPAIPPLTKHSEKVFYESLREYIRSLEKRILLVEERNQARKQTRIDRNVTPSYIEISGNTTLSESEMWQTIVINPSTNVVVTLPTADPGMWVTIVHAGSSGVLTVHNGTNPLAEIDPGGIATIYSSSNAGTASWVSGAIQVASGGTALSKQAVLVDNANAGIILKDSSGDYWRITIDTAGALTSANLGSDRATSSGYETE